MSTAAKPPAPLADPAFRRLALVWTASNFADSMLYLTLAIWVKDLTGSTSAAGLVFAALGLPALLAPLTGHLADRMPRRRLIAAANLVAATGVLVLLTVRTTGTLWLVYAVTVGYGTIGYLTSAAQSGLLRDLLPEGSLATANGLLTTIDQGLRLLTPLLGAGLYAQFGPYPVVLTTATLFAIAGLLMTTVQVRESPPTAAALRASFRHEVTAGIRHLRRTAALGRLTVVLAVAVGATGVASTTIFATIERGLRLGPEFFGVLASIQGLGSVLGGLTAARLIRRYGERPTVAAGLVLIGVGVASTAAGNLGVVCAGTAIAGVGVPWAIVAFVTLRQRLTPPTLQGRVAAATTMAMNVPQTAAAALAAAALVLIDYRIMIAVTAAAVLAAAAAAAVAPVRRRATAVTG
jgi:MFS family permease